MIKKIIKEIQNSGEFDILLDRRITCAEFGEKIAERTKAEILKEITFEKCPDNDNCRQCYEMDVVLKNIKKRIKGLK